MTQDCPYRTRLSECPFGCGKEFKGYFNSLHLLRCPEAPRSAEPVDDSAPWSDLVETDDDAEAEADDAHQCPVR